MEVFEILSLGIEAISILKSAFEWVKKKIPKVKLDNQRNEHLILYFLIY